MTAILLGFLAHTWPYLVAGVTGFLGILWAHQSGVKSERAKQAQAELRARNEADKIEDAIAGRSVDENRTRLRGWARK